MGLFDANEYMADNPAQLFEMLAAATRLHAMVANQEYEQAAAYMQTLDPTLVAFLFAKLRSSWEEFILKMRELDGLLKLFGMDHHHDLKALVGAIRPHLIEMSATIDRCAKQGERLDGLTASKQERALSEEDARTANDLLSKAGINLLDLFAADSAQTQQTQETND